MPVVAVYVPAASKRNLEISLRESLWGWKQYIADTADTPRVLAALKAGDYLLLGHRGPNARVPHGGWSDAVLRELAVARVTGPVTLQTTSMWPDDVYPVRVPLDVLGIETSVSGDELGAEAMEALRLSANKQGAPVPVPDEVLDRFMDSMGRRPIQEGGPEAGLPASTDLPGSDLTDPAVRYLDLDPDSDRPTRTFAHRETAGLRHVLFTKPTAECALCGRTLPTGLLRAAHIRKRSQSNLEQRSHLANVMAVCVLGCDALFEDGFVLVTAEGRVEASPKAGMSEDLLAAAEAIAGRQCTAHSEASEEYFAWHRENVASSPSPAAAPSTGTEVRFA
ncbi:hypothetical protein ACGF0D_38920 [Kitasatospora sp. NPDC048298]|uniref:hypothetical protein n=1 Tax=Kitasatospora sp. NPDC048298 TaxID=3364049 RepID=UPI003713ABE3